MTENDEFFILSKIYGSHFCGVADGLSGYVSTVISDKKIAFVSLFSSL